MKRSRFSEERIIGILRQAQAGVRAADLCRQHGISDVTFYKWRAKFGGMDVSDAKRPRQLEEENSRLKKLERLRPQGRLPRGLRTDNGPEFTCRALDAWTRKHGVGMEHSRPGKPTDNGFVESLTGTSRMNA